MERLPLNEQLIIIEKVLQRLKKATTITQPSKTDYDSLFGFMNVENIDEEIKALRDEWERKV
jgi:hypothetical protein